MFKSDQSEAMRAKDKSINQGGGFGGRGFGGGPMRGFGGRGRPSPYERLGGGGGFGGSHGSGGSFEAVS